MRIIVLPRGTGKTSILIRESARTGFYIVCLSQDECSRIQREAMELNLKIPFPITHQEFIKGSYNAQGVKGLLIDNADILLERMAKAPIHTITLSNKDYEYEKIMEDLSRTAESN
jgi:hypothetical protein